jgi:sulfofructose kinase
VAGDIIVAGLTRAGVGTQWVRRAEGARSALSVGLIVPSPANTRSLVALSAMGTGLTIPEDALEACRAAAWIHVDHAGWRLVATLRAAGVRTPISVDGGNPLTPERWADADLYVPGEAELLRSTGQADVAAALEVAADRGASCTIVTLGAAGSRYLGVIDQDASHADTLIRARTPSLAAARSGCAVASPIVNVRSTLGAGDVYHGALLAGLIRGRSIRDAMRYASAAAALSCQGLDGRSAIPTHDEVVVAIHLSDQTP